MRQFNKYFTGAVLLLIIALNVTAQEHNIKRQEQYWVGYSITKKFNKQWSAKFYTEDRRYFQNNRDHMFYAMTDATYRFKKHWSVTAGFMYFTLARPSDPSPDIVVRQREYRPYQSIFYGLHIGKKSSLSIGTKLEQRIRMRIENNEQTDDYFTYIRFRNKVSFKYRIGEFPKGKPLHFYAFDEYHVHFGNAVKGNVFDQNRLSAGLAWAFYQV